jgi:4-alpha-glucanotransferase
MNALERLAKEAGLAVQWADVDGKAQTVAPDVLRTVLAALSFPAGNARQIADSRARLREACARPQPLIVAVPGGKIACRGRRARFLGEDGAVVEAAVRGGQVQAPRHPGYWRLEDEGRTLAVVPRRAFAMPLRPCWGVAVQLYALRGSAGIGDFAALAGFAQQAAAQGAAAVAISPVHVLFGAAPDHISPYSPSSRLFLNPLYAPIAGRDSAHSDMIDWPKAAAARLAAQRRAFEDFRRDGAEAAFEAFVRRGGSRLLSHARFEVLDRQFRAQGLYSWRDWPAPYRNPVGPGARALKPSHPDIAFQLFLQWRAETALAAAQARCRQAGMAIGLISDLAVGMDPAGSHAWSAPDEVLRGLSIGAPPDFYNAAGQNWGLTGFSPQGLARGGYDGFIETLRAAMRHAGGIRLDHAMGLMRLWVIPDGARPTEGVYLHYPFAQMLGLLLLESRRNRAVVIAEDLGTVPQGFRERIARAGLSGMRVLWFERDREGGFLPPRQWDESSAALSTTHDLPTLAGWWRGRDIQWRARLDAAAQALKAERKQRARDRRLLWKMLREAGCAEGAMPSPAAPARFADAAVKALAETPCRLALLPVEDFIGESEQPNIPGTTAGHPNWRRRLKRKRPLAAAAAKRRAAILNTGRP